MTVNEQLDEFVTVAASFAIQETEVTPFGKTDPEGGVQVIVTPGQLSVAIAVNVTTAVQRFASVGLVIFAGQVIVGT